MVNREGLVENNFLGLFIAYNPVFLKRVSFLLKNLPDNFSNQNIDFGDPYWTFGCFQET